MDLDMGQRSVDRMNDEYDKYILNHTENVLKAYCQNGKQILRAMGNESLDQELFNLVNTHDKSKFSTDEFDAYRKFFYPASGENKDLVKKEMDAGWLHHMNTNKHHPEYWLVRDKDGIRPLDMERVYIAEMILDWIAMGYKFNSNALQWWKKNNEYYKKIMSKATYYTVEKILKELYPEGE